MKWTRRQWLERFGAGAITMALPQLEVFGAPAAPRPKNLVLFHFGNGAPAAPWKSFEIQREGLGTMANRCTLMRGLSLEELVKPLANNGVNGHAAGMMTVLTGTPALPDPADRQIGWHYQAGGQSFDQLVARFINGGRPVRFWGGNTRPEMPKESFLSFSGPGAGRLPLTRTRDILGAFSGVAGKASATEAATRLHDQRLMSGMKEQADALNKRLGVSDRQRVDQYLTAIAEVQANSAPPPSVKGRVNRQCKKPGIEAATTMYTFGPNHTKNLFELTFRALQCDVSRVMVFSIAAPGGGPIMRDMGIDSDQPDHGPSHHGNKPEALELYRQSSLYKMRLFSEFLRKLDSEKGPDGKTVLDNSAVVCFSEMGEGDKHSPENVPAIVAGGAFKRPKEGFVDAEGPMANLWLTTMRSLGISDAQVPSFGNATGTIPALLG